MPRKALAGGKGRTCHDKVGVTPLGKERRMHGFKRLLRCEEGANAIEYALVATLIAIAALAAYQNLGNKVDQMYNNVSNNLR